MEMLRRGISQRLARGMASRKTPQQGGYHRSSRILSVEVIRKLPPWARVSLFLVQYPFRWRVFAERRLQAECDSEGNPRVLRTIAL